MRHPLSLLAAGCLSLGAQDTPRFVMLGSTIGPIDAGIVATLDNRPLKTLAAKQAPFLTRGDQSGTHVAELELWSKVDVKPSGSWYQVFAKGAEGNAPTLRHADQSGLYTVIDRATWLTLKPELKGQILVEGDEALLNHISLIPVNPANVAKVNTTDTATFVAWLTHPDKGQKRIASFGKAKYGAPLFFPEARKQ